MCWQWAAAGSSEAWCTSLASHFIFLLFLLSQFFSWTSLTGEALRRSQGSPMLHPDMLGCISTCSHHLSQLIEFQSTHQWRSIRALCCSAGYPAQVLVSTQVCLCGAWLCIAVLVLNIGEGSLAVSTCSAGVSMSKCCQQKHFVLQGVCPSCPVKLISSLCCVGAVCSTLCSCSLLCGSASAGTRGAV